MRTLALVLSLLVSVPAVAQQKTPPSASDKTTLADRTLRHAAVSTQAISGTSASALQSLRVPDGAWVYGLSMGERADNPCYLSLWWADVDDGEMKLGLSEFNRCRTNPTNSSLTSVGMSTTARWDDYGNDYYGHGADLLTTDQNVLLRAATTVSYAGSHPGETYRHLAAMFNGGTPRFPLLLHSSGVTALKSLEVCHRDANDKLKGLSVRGVTLELQDSDSRARTRPIRRANGDWDSDGFFRNTCDDRRPVRACPAQLVIVGVDVHYDTGRNAVIKGLTPVCAHIEG